MYPSLCARYAKIKYTSLEVYDYTSKIIGKRTNDKITW